MTDKQIIVDGVDVNALYSDQIACMNRYEVAHLFIKTVEQLKRKEQECERLKEELILKDVANIELSDEVKKYIKAIDEIEEIADNNYEIPEMEQIFLIIGGLDV